jgi:dTDP-4-amino-4,6-dideoxygalactose transaminase
MNYAMHTLDRHDANAVAIAMWEAVNGGALTQGPLVEQFEHALADYCGADYAVACSNGSTALWLAYKAAGMGLCDEVLTTPISFVATANAAKSLDANVSFCDVQRNGWNMDIATADTPSMKWSYDYVVPVHMTGESCDMVAIWDKAKAMGATVIEDAAHALGGTYMHDRIGACTYSDACCFSFHPSKSITTGEGGAITTNDECLYLRMKQLRNHGRGVDGQCYELGINGRMSELQAALGLCQLKRLDEFVERRRYLAKRYVQALDNCVDVPIFNNDSAWHLFVIRTPRRNELKRKLEERGIMTQIHYQPITSMPLYADKTPNEATMYSAECLSLPLYPSLRDSEQDEVVAAVKEALA